MPGSTRNQTLRAGVRRVGTVLAGMGIAVTAALAMAPAADAASSIDGCGRLASGDRISSPDGHYYTGMQGDGNLVTYSAPRALWALNTANNPGAYLSVQCDGNLVLVAQNGAARWASGTNGNPGAYLAMQNDANLVLVAKDGRALWSSKGVDSRLQAGQSLRPNWSFQSPDRRYRMVMQSDGNLVLVGPNGAATWASNHTNRQPGSSVEMQSDGNLVVYNSSHQALWATNTRTGGAALVGQDDGNFVIYGDGGAVWSTRNAGASSGSAAQSAKQILGNSRITFSDYSENRSSDSAVRSLASQQMRDIADGKPANLSTRCSYSRQLPASVQPDPQILRFMADLGNQSSYRVSVLFGQCHSGSGSLHHQGKAVDIECGLDTARADAVGRSYGVSRNGETCAADKHWHYSVGGR